jgi:hypothetical protein
MQLAIEKSLGVYEQNGGSGVCFVWPEQLQKNSIHIITGPSAKVSGGAKWDKVLSICWYLVFVVT